MVEGGKSEFKGTGHFREDESNYYEEVALGNRGTGMTTLPLGSEACDTWGREATGQRTYLGMVRLFFMA